MEETKILTAWSVEKLQIPVVAAEQFGIGRSNSTSMSTNHNLQQVLVHFDNGVGNTLIAGEEDDGEECHLKLGADANEGAAQWFHQAFPAELQVNDVIVRIWLRELNTRDPTDETMNKTEQYWML